MHNQGIAATHRYQAVGLMRYPAPTLSRAPRAAASTFPGSFVLDIPVGEMSRRRTRIGSPAFGPRWPSASPLIEKGDPKAAQCLETASYAEESRRLQLTSCRGN
jgi:hypothetical protein